MPIIVLLFTSSQFKNIETLKQTLLQAINAAGSLIQQRFQTDFAINSKDTINNLVTEIDEAAERLIIQIIKDKFPQHGVIGEEYGSKDLESEYKWIIDPIDGTVNFAHGVPLCCVSIGLMYGDDIVLGAVYNPMMNELFFAEKGKGATLNGQPIKVSAKSDLQQSFLVTGFPYQYPEGKDPVRIFEHFLKKGLPIRRLGSAALDLCWVAAGRFDAFWEYNLQPWDMAAGILIIDEAGGRVSDFSGSKMTVWNKEIIASNGILHEMLLSEINSVL